MTAVVGEPFALPEWGPTEDQATIEYRAGYLAARHGRYDQADGAWSRALVSASPALAAVVYAARGSAARQFGLHARAEADDERALSLAEDGPTAAAALIGLAADRVGHGDLTGASARLVAAVAAVAGLGDALADDRQRIRLAWVRAEVALMSGASPPRLPVARGDGTVDRPAEYRAGTRYHEAKGLLFGGVVRRDAASLAAAADRAPASLLWAVELARSDLGDPGALARAAAAWGQVVVPARLRGEVAATATTQRLTQGRSLGSSSRAPSAP